jgi:hypothetical protein
MTESEVINLAPLSQIRGDESAGKIWCQIAETRNFWLISLRIVGGPLAERTDLYWFAMSSVE